MLPETFGKARFYFPASLFAGFFHHIDVFIQAVMCHKPMPLAFMTAKHLLLGVHHAGYINYCAGLNLRAELVLLFSRIHIVKMRYGLERFGAGRLNALNPACKTGRLGYLTRHFVVNTRI